MTRTVTIWTTNETPRCGSGRRIVRANVGRRYVRLYPLTEAAHPDRVSKKVFERIVVDPTSSTAIKALSKGEC